MKFDDNYFINSALRTAIIHLDNVEKKKGQLFSIKEEFLRLYKERTGKDIQVRKGEYTLNNQTEGKNAI